ncbi:septum formation family protein [Allokutzneria sp. NRRL B-24872]|uniref:septum formation family protein n=1 Tax=Allokutzneria sp. NRRL B-24872 TaxID=1137961 RepID=UPI00143D14FD|nr:septum formation family protein [Allokutzneria sp. NRRL B-24872]
MLRHRRSGTAVLALSAFALLTGCTAAVSPEPLPVTQQPSQPGEARPQATTSAAGTGTALASQCIDGKRFVVVDCAQQHELEVTQPERFPATMPKEYPDEAALLAVAMPKCRAHALAYVGDQLDASRLQSWPVWPTKDGWAKGERWLTCAAVELGPDDKPVSRTGSVRAAMAGANFYKFQVCTAGSPSRDNQLKLAPCDQAHLGEAVPWVLSLGKATDPAPSPEQMNAASEPHCKAMANQYLAAPNGRKDLTLTWRLPEVKDWPLGHTTAVCYLESAKPLTKTLLNIGENAPLPS